MNWYDPFFEIFVEIGKVIIILLTTVYNTFIWSGDVVATYGGEPARLLFYIIILLVIPFILISYSIAQTQASIETFQAGTASFFLKAVIVGLIVFVLLFVLSQI